MNQKLSFYTDRIHTFKKQTGDLQKQNRNLSFLRLFSAIGAFVFFYSVLSYSALIASAVAITLVFSLIYFVRRYNRNSKNIKRLQALIQINENEIRCLKTRHSDLYYDGEEYLKQNHSYASDLDIFGQHSLFQLINRSVTKTGNNTLASWLEKPSPNQEIIKRQKAVKELSKKIDWRQNIIQYGFANKLKNDDPSFVIEWGKKPSPFHGKKVLQIAVTIMPLLSLGALVYSFISSQAPITIMILASIGIHYYNFRKVSRAHEQTSKRGEMLKTYSYIIEQFEKENWNSEKLNELKSKLGSNDRLTSKKIQQLSKLIELLDQRLNVMVQILLNLLFFYELHILFRIDKWKQNYGAEIEKWFDAISEIEAISSLSNLSFNHEEWAFPKISDKHFELDVKQAGHPMIDEKGRVNNDYQLNGPGTVHIVTGSNMAGKSTFLRTVGVNVVMALAGAPVCAQEMTVSNVEINTSMRIKDSIEDNESSFYAELKRIQQVIEKVNKKEKTLLLLDEILRGTNSKDKHTGSRALIKQLVKHDAVAMVATHDLELSILEEELPGQVENRFFDIKIDGDQLYFDYKVQKGFCKTFNAPILMKKMGIDLEILKEA
ncbi:MutS-related protein [Labilibaculum euxinus]